MAKGPFSAPLLSPCSKGGKGAPGDIHTYLVLNKQKNSKALCEVKPKKTNMLAFAATVLHGAI